MLRETVAYDAFLPPHHSSQSGKGIIFLIIIIVLSGMFLWPRNPDTVYASLFLRLAGF